MKTETDPIVCIIGYIDAYGAIHYKAIPLGKSGEWTHDTFWPTQTHKRWRFEIDEWMIDDSVLSKDNLTPVEMADVTALMRRKFKPPLWVIQGEEWEALGRPHSGKALERHEKRWARIYARQRR
jgi:hypothetical protein